MLNNNKKDILKLLISLTLYCFTQFLYSFLHDYKKEEEKVVKLLFSIFTIKRLVHSLLKKTQRKCKHIIIVYLGGPTQPNFKKKLYLIQFCFNFLLK